jgi:PAS domain S-box-containing protein
MDPNGAVPANEALPRAVPAREESAGAVERERAKAARHLRLLRLRFQELCDRISEGYLVTDRNGVIQEANDAAAALLHARKAFLAGKPLGLFVTESDRPAFYARLSRVNRLADSGEPWEVLLRVPRGAVVHLLVGVTCLPDEDGAASALQWVLRDVTLWHRAEHALRSQRSFADSIVDAAPSIILVVDVWGTILRSNRHLQEVSGYEPGELNGRDWCSVFLLEPEWRFARNLLRRALNYGAGERAIFPLITKDGRRRAVAWSAKGLAHGAPGGAAALLLGHDVTDLQEAQRQALQAEHLAAIGQMVAGLAHESRNALQRTQACLERLAWRLHNQPEALDLLARAQKAQEDLVRLYEDVRGYAAPVVLRPAVCNLAEIWREAWGQVAAVHPAREATLFEETAGVDLRCRADRFRLLQVFRNVLDNAFAACRGPVRVTVSCRAADLEGRPALRVAVRDNGPGLAAGQKEHLFEPFFTTKVKGTGLGLALVKRLVEAHGGQVAAGDAAGAPGAEIVITLPRSSS